MQTATAKQTAYLVRLYAERGVTLPAEELDGLSKESASKMIGDILTIPRAAKPVVVAATTAAPVTEPGMYRGPDGSPVRVKRAQDSDRLYAAKLVQIGGARLTEADTVVRFEFQYEKGLFYRLTAGDRMTLDEAKAFGIRYGICCVCAAHLKDATSVANGIGPVCAKRV